MKIMRMTNKGTDSFIEYLNEVKTDPSIKLPPTLLQEGEYAEIIGNSDTKWLDELDLSDKLATARALNDIINRLNLESAENDIGFWVWCSAYLFEKLCKKKNNKKTPGEVAIWVPQYSWRRYYRHYLCSIWRVYLAHNGNEKALKTLLFGPVNTPGELWGQIAATQSLIINPSVLDAIYHLFWDKSKNKRKVGAGGESARRLTAVLGQFACTWDLFSQSSEQIVEMLPVEFDRFKELNNPSS